MKRKTVNSKGELNLDLKPIAGKFAMAVRDGAAREIACFGTRGDGKTFAALVAMIMHSVAHKAAGYPLPVDGSNRYSPQSRVRPAGVAACAG